MAYPEKRDGKQTGHFYGERIVTKDGATTRFRARFDRKKDAEGYEIYVGLMGCEPPSMNNGGNVVAKGRTYREVALACKANGGPDGKWKAGRDNSVIQRLEYSIAVIGDLDIADVGPKAFKKIRESLEKRPAGAGKKLTDSTINRYLSAPSCVLTYAINEEIIEHRAKTPLKAERNKPRDILRSFEQEQAICSWLTAQGYPIDAFLIEVLATAGARRGEFFKLRAEQIDDEQINFGHDQTKNDEERIVWIGPERAAKLRALVAAGALPNAFQLLRRFKKACKACGYMGNLVLHSLRHTRNTRLRKQGVDMKTRMKMLGQRSVTTSMRYDHVDTEDQLVAAKKVEEARGYQPQKGSVVPMRRTKKALRAKVLEATSGIEPECTVLQTDVSLVATCNE